MKKLDVGNLIKGKCVTSLQSYRIDLNKGVDLNHKILFCSVRATHYYHQIKNMLSSFFLDLPENPTHQIYRKKKGGT